MRETTTQTQAACEDCGQLFIPGTSLEAPASTCAECADWSARCAALPWEEEPVVPVYDHSTLDLLLETPTAPFTISGLAFETEEERTARLARLEAEWAGQEPEMDEEHAHALAEVAEQNGREHRERLLTGTGGSAPASRARFPRY